MPNIGEIRTSEEIGHKSGSQYVWYACPGCGKEGWKRLRGEVVRSERCPRCSKLMSRGANWKGGRRRTHRGYVEVKIDEDDFFSPMRTRAGYIKEHRLVIAKSIGRNLHSWEIVHHKNGNKTDNRIENLQLVTDDRHKQITLLENKIKKLESILKQNGIKHG